jgi:hypothetical protein
MLPLLNGKIAFIHHLTNINITVHCVHYRYLFVKIKEVNQSIDHKVNVTFDLRKTLADRGVRDNVFNNYGKR